MFPFSVLNVTLQLKHKEEDLSLINILNNKFKFRDGEKIISSLRKTSLQQIWSISKPNFFFAFSSYPGHLAGRWCNFDHLKKKMLGIFTLDSRQKFGRSNNLNIKMCLAGWLLNSSLFDWKMLGGETSSYHLYHGLRFPHRRDLFWFWYASWPQRGQDEVFSKII